MGAQVKVERDEPWIGLFNSVMKRFVHADSWRMELMDRNGALLSILASGDDIALHDQIFRQTLARLEAAAVAQKRESLWTKSEIDDDQDVGQPHNPRCLILFICHLATGELLRGGVVLKDPGHSRMASPVETDVLNLVAAAAAGVARELRLAKERWAVHRLISLLALDCLIVNKCGQIVFKTPQVADAFGLNDLQCETAVSPLKGVISEAMAQYRSGSGTGAHHCRFAIVKGGGKQTVPLHVLPLSTNEVESGSSFFALLVPRESPPPTDETLARILSLTLAEAKVVRHIVNGKRVSSIAEEMALAEQTVRTYLKRAYGKLGVSSQCELIARVNALLIPLKASV